PTRLLMGGTFTALPHQRMTRRPPPAVAYAVLRLHPAQCALPVIFLPPITYFLTCHTHKLLVFGREQNTVANSFDHPSATWDAKRSLRTPAFAAPAAMHAGGTSLTLLGESPPYPFLRSGLATPLIILMPSGN